MLGILKIIRRNIWICAIPFLFYISNFIYTRVVFFIQVKNFPDIGAFAPNIKQHIFSLKQYENYVRFFIETLNNLDYSYVGVFASFLLMIVTIICFITHPYILKKLRLWADKTLLPKIKIIKIIFFVVMYFLLIAGLFWIANHYFLKNKSYNSYTLFALNPVLGTIFVLVLSLFEAGFVWAVYNTLSKKKTTLNEIAKKALEVFPGVYAFNLIITFLGYLPSLLYFIINEYTLNKTESAQILSIIPSNSAKIIGFGLPIVKTLLFFVPIIIIVENKSLKTALLETINLVLDNFVKWILFVTLCISLIYIPMTFEWVIMGFLNPLSFLTQGISFTLGTIFLILTNIVFVLTLQFFINIRAQKRG